MNVLMLQTLLGCLLFLVVIGGNARAEEFPVPYNSETEPGTPMSAQEAAETAVLPPGFRCEVFASEPDVQQPIAMCFDHSGRLWVAECYTYAERPDRWDPELRDRIIILRDSDGDGKADQRSVFWDQGQRLTSIAWTDDGVYAICAPQLLFIPDANHDDVPDGDAVVLLDGFEVESIGHNVANGLKIGPDGWLYGRHGITSVSLVGAPDSPDSLRTKVNCSIWRYHPKRGDFEVFCNGGTNPWGLDWNADGQLFYTNTVIGHLWHAIPGAYYRRMFGAHLNSHVYEVITHTADHYHWDTGQESWNDIRKGMTSSTAALGGGHAHMGCLIYKSGVWPKQYHGKLFTCNLHGRRINMDVLERDGCGYVAHHGKDFMLMKDPFFRGLDVLAGPDGQMWINDWSDTGECHDNTGLHRTSGRIFRVVYVGDDAGERTPDFQSWLTDRAQPNWDANTIDRLLASGDEAKRALAIRFLAEDAPEDSATFDQLLHAAEHDPSGLVRLEVAAALQRLPIERRLPVATLLADHREDADDRQQPLMIWYGIEPSVPANPKLAVAMAMSSKIPTVRRLIARRLCEDLDEHPEPVSDLLDSAVALERTEARSQVLSGMSEALRGRARATPPKHWDTVVAAVERNGSPSEREQVRDLSALFGDGRARDTLLSIAFDQNAEAGARRSALRSLLRQPTAELLPRLTDSINDRILAVDVVRGLAFYDDAGVSARLISRWRNAPIDRPVVIDSLVARPKHAADLLDAVADGTIPRDAISPFQARQIENHADPKLSDRLRKLWGNIRESSEVKQKESDRWKAFLTEERLQAADPLAGKAVFVKQCATCHQLYADGRKVGPNLTGSDRHNLDYLLGNLVDPSAVVAADYRMSVFLLEDGRVVSGVVSEENDRTVTVQTQQAELRLDKELVVQRKGADVSLMPEGILAQLSEQEVANLVAYLMTKAPIRD